jgi:dynein heavy chain
MLTHQVRWKETADSIGSRRDLLIGDVFLCAACISYYGAFSGPYRNALVSSWVAKFQVEPSIIYLLRYT